MVAFGIWIKQWLYWAVNQYRFVFVTRAFFVQNSQSGLRKIVCTYGNATLTFVFLSDKDWSLCFEIQWATSITNRGIRFVDLNIEWIDMIDFVSALSLKWHTSCTLERKQFRENFSRNLFRLCECLKERKYQKRKEKQLDETFY